MNPYQKAHIYQWHKYQNLDRLLILASTIRSFNSYILSSVISLNHDGIAAFQGHYRKNFIKSFPCFTKYFYDKYLGKDNDLMNVTCVIFEYVKGIILNVIVILQCMQMYRQMRSKSTRL